MSDIAEVISIVGPKKVQCRLCLAVFMPGIICTIGTCAPHYTNLLCEACTKVIDECSLRNDKIPNLQFLELQLPWDIKVLTAVDAFKILHAKPPTNSQIPGIVDARYHNPPSGLWEKSEHAVRKAKVRLEKARLYKEPQPHDRINKTSISTRNNSSTTVQTIGFHRFAQACFACNNREVPVSEWELPKDWKEIQHKGNSVLACKKCAEEVEIWKTFSEKFT